MSSAPSLDPSEPIRGPELSSSHRKSFNQLLARARHYRNSGQDDLASELAGQITRRWPGRLHGWLFHARLLEESGQATEAKQLVEGLVEQIPGTAQKAHEWLARFAVRNGMLELAERALESAKEGGTEAAVASGIEHAILRARRDRQVGRLAPDRELGFQQSMDCQPSRRALVKRVISDELVAVPEAGAETAVVVFTGIRDRLVLLDRFFSPRRLTAIYCRDMSHRAGLFGLASVAASADETAHRLRETAARYGARRLVMLGNSVGGFAAIHYAHLSNADAVLSFAPPVHLGNSFMDGIGDDRARQTRLMLNSEREEESLDLRALLMARTRPLDVEVYYGESMDLDRKHAEHLLGVPGVELHPVPGCSTHTVLRHLISEDHFGAVLDRALARQSAEGSGSDVGCGR